MTDWSTEVLDRLAPATAAEALSTSQLTLVLAVAAVVVAVPAVWRIVRLAVTLVHELGHAFVGVLVGRKFTGFVLRGDMSGHAVTYGPERGVGRVLTTWAGYPAPAVVGAALVWLAGRGWSSATLAVLLLLLVVALVRVRSALTLLVMVGVLAIVVSLWWWGRPEHQAQVLAGVGVVLLVGAWRHLGALRGDRSRSSDPGVLVSLTRVPRVLWLVSFVLACAAATWLVVMQLIGLT